MVQLSSMYRVKYLWRNLQTKKARSRQYPIETIIDEDYADQVFLANTPTQAESLLHSLEQAARGIGLNMNSDKTEFMYFKQNGAISISNGKPLELVDQFPYLSSNISSTESNVDIYKGKARTSVNRLSIIWKSDL